MSYETKQEEEDGSSHMTYHRDATCHTKYGSLRLHAHHRRSGMLSAYGLPLIFAWAAMAEG